MWIYRSGSGEAEIRSWCRARLASRLPEHRSEPWPGNASLAVPEYHAAHLVITGEQHASTVVLLPGRYAAAATMTDLIVALSERRRVVTVDVPGEPGLASGGWPNTDRMRDFGDWLNRLLADLATRLPGGITVLGHEFGAAVALAAKPHPAVSGLVLLNPTGMVRRALTPRVALALAAWRGIGGPGPARRLLTTLGGPGWQPEPDLVEWVASVGRHVAMSSTPGPRPEWIPRWGSVPNVVAVGEYDPVVGDGRLDNPVRRMLGTDVVTIPGAGALSPYECPDAVVELLDHLDRDSGGDPRGWKPPCDSPRPTLPGG